MATRRPIWENLQKNGDFELAPTFVAPTTSTSVFITGTATGSASNDAYTWATNKGGTGQAMFDTAEKYSGNYSMKVSTLAAGSFMYARAVPGTATNQKLRLNAITVAPNTSYTVEFWMKTNLVSGASASGARLAVVQYNGAATALTTVLSTAVITTTGWTKYSFNFTTQATCNFIELQCRVTGNDGAATLIMDGWFDDISVKPTTQTVRLAI
ncbi:carbohydrate binding domain-containing protein [Pseudarthrobacter sp. ATCC 49987]|uniref:carbohydrate binding domain-containing protein n=1 Tax=Pseudarthrobacter sp. ATCC 49987 TaxID=2698204 RepID=UPI00136983C4|nr:carbohydrate binding domain-containing protein [Pseudarthrobacter sp. ATCC 49987]